MPSAKSGGWRGPCKRASLGAVAARASASVSPSAFVRIGAARALAVRRKERASAGAGGRVGGFAPGAERRGEREKRPATHPAAVAPPPRMQHFHETLRSRFHPVFIRLFLTFEINSAMIFHRR